MIIGLFEEGVKVYKTPVYRSSSELYARGTAGFSSRVAS